MEVTLEMPQSWGAALSFLPFAVGFWPREGASCVPSPASAGLTVVL